MTWCW